MNIHRYIHKKMGVRRHDMPPYVTGHNRSKLPELFNDLGYKVGAEIGVLDGGYALELCKCIPGLHLTCVDPWVPYHVFSQSQMDRKFNNVTEKLRDYNVTILRKHSEVACESIPDGALDFIYIDALHDFDHVMIDIIRWVPKVRLGGIVAGHDYFQDYRQGVVVAVDAYTKAYGISRLYVTRELAASWFWVVE